MEHAAVDVVLPEWTLGERLRKARETAGIEPRVIAEMLGASTPSIYAWENGNRQPRNLVAVVQAYAKVTNVPLEWLWTGRYEIRPAGSSHSAYPSELVEWDAVAVDQVRAAA